MPVDRVGWAHFGRRWCGAWRIRGLKTGQAAWFRAGEAGPPQHFLYFAPERQGQGALRGTLLLTAELVEWGSQNEVTGLGAGSGVGGAGAAGLQNEVRPDSR